MRAISKQMRAMMIGGMRRAPLAALLITLALSALAAGPGPQPRAAVPHGAVEPTTAPQGDGPVYEIEYQFAPDVSLYYTIEDEFRDSGSVPGWLSYSTTVSDRRSIIQTVTAPASGPASAPAKPAASKSAGVRVSWECDRYEVRERGPKGSEVGFDSLRDLYPPPSLHDLGGVAGSRCTFSIDPATGRPSELKTVPGPMEGPPTSLRPSRTALRCALNEKTLTDLLRDLGPLFLPDGPKRVGDRWTSVQTEMLETFGTVITNLTCTLRGVREVDGRLIASIELTGEMKLAKPPGSSANGSSAASAPGSQPGSAPALTQPPSRKSASAPAATKPTGSAPARQQPPAASRAAGQSTQKEFVLETAVYAGSMEFDLTRGQLVELTLRRELGGAAKFEVAKPDPLIPTEIRAGTAHVRRVRVARTAPTKPIIVGGRKPPVIPPDQMETTKPAVKKPSPTTQPGRSTTAATTPTSVPQHYPTMQPAAVGRPASTTRPGIPYGPQEPPGLDAATQRTPQTIKPASRLVRPAGQSSVRDKGNPTSRPGSMGRPAAQPASTATQPAHPPVRPVPSAP
jgi:hypothetical protein